MVSLKNNPKRERLQLLQYNKSVPTQIAIIAVAALIFALLSFVLQFLNYGAVSRLSKKPPVLVQLSSGSTIVAKAVEPNERTSEVLKKFVSDTFIEMFSWDGKIYSYNDKGELITQQDTGVDIGGIGQISSRKVTSKAYYAAFAITENQNFREAFLQKLAQLTPPGIFTGQMQSSLILQHISEPRKIKDGKWEVDMVATLLMVNSNHTSQGFAFNKTVTIEAVSTPQEIPSDVSELSRKIYTVRKAGVEITQITDFKP